jgi:hypothetical protein
MATAIYFIYFIIVPLISIIWDKLISPTR